MSIKSMCLNFVYRARYILIKSSCYQPCQMVITCLISIFPIKVANVWFITFMANQINKISSGSQLSYGRSLASSYHLTWLIACVYFINFVCMEGTSLFNFLQSYSSTITSELSKWDSVSPKISTLQDTSFCNFLIYLFQYKEHHYMLLYARESFSKSVSTYHE